MAKNHYTDEFPEVLAPKTSEGRFDWRGRELLDPTPLEIAIAESVGASMGDIVRQLVQQAMKQHLGVVGNSGEPDDEDDFEVEEDLSTMSQYTVDLQNRAVAEALQKAAPKVRDEGDVDPDLEPPPEQKSPLSGGRPPEKKTAAKAADTAAGAASQQ